MTVNTAKFVLVVGAVLFSSAGTVRFGEAWLYLGLNLAWLTLAGMYFLAKDPAFLRVLGAVTLVVAGVDHRFGWSAAPFWVVATGCALFVCGVGVVLTAFLENAYASSIIEVDPAQPVVVTGLYRVLRHPMYTGTLVMGFATPLVLGSYCALLLLPPGWALLVVRILAEERFLSRELRGYAEYMSRTPYRLIPGVW